VVESKKRNCRKEAAFIKALVVICCLLCLPVAAHAGLAEMFNPTALWECRDSLRSLQREPAFEKDAGALLSHIPTLKLTLDSAKELLPSPMFYVEVMVYSDSLTKPQRHEIMKRVKKKKYHVIATDSDSLGEELADVHEPFGLINITDPECVRLIAQLESYTDERHATIRELIKKIQTEFDLVSLGLAMRAYRKDSGKIWKVYGLLVTDDVINLDHCKKILRLLNVRYKKL